MALQSPVDKRTTLDIERQLDARADSIRRHLAELRHELTSAGDLTAAGQPVLDRVRSHPEQTLAVAAGAGAAVGATLGFSAWLEKRREARRTSHARVLLASVLGGASERLSRGGQPEETLKAFAKKGGPLVYLGAPPSPARGTIRETLDLAVKTALGFGVKTGMDMLTKKLTGKPEVFGAAKDATESPPPERPYG